MNIFSFNFEKNYTNQEMRSFIYNNPDKAEELICYNLEILGQIKDQNDQLTFNIRKGIFHIDQSSYKHKFKKLTSLEQEFNLIFLKNFQQFAKEFFANVNSNKDKTIELNAKLEKAQKGLQILEKKACKQGNKNDAQLIKKIINSMKKMQVEMQNSLDIRLRNSRLFIENKIKVWKAELSNLEGEAAEEEALHQTFLLLKNQLKGEMYLKVFEQLSEKDKKLFIDLFVYCESLFIHKNEEEKKEIELSLFTEFLLAKEKLKIFNQLITALKKLENNQSISKSDLNKLKRITINNSQLFFYTPSILPKKPKAQPNVIPLAFKIHHYTTGIGKLLAGGIAILIGVLFPPAMYLAIAGFKLLKKGITQLSEGVEANMIEYMKNGGIQWNQIEIIKENPDKFIAQVAKSYLDIQQNKFELDQALQNPDDFFAKAIIKIVDSKEY